MTITLWPRSISFWGLLDVNTVGLDDGDLHWTVGTCDFRLLLRLMSTAPSLKTRLGAYRAEGRSCR